MAGDSDEGKKLVEQKQEFFDSFFKKGAEFTRDLLRENERLRRRIAQLEEQVAMTRAPVSDSTLHELVQKIHELEGERNALMARFAEIEQLEGRLEERFAEIERENNDLAALFVAQGQLFGSLQVREVVAVFVEVLLNFVGADAFALLLRREQGGFGVLASHGLDPEAVRLDDPLFSAVLDDEGEYLAEGLDVAGRDPRTEDPLVCFAVRERDGPIGVIAIWSLLPQKTSLVGVDRQIFELLSQSGGMALEAARRAAGVNGAASLEAYRNLSQRT